MSYDYSAKGFRPAVKVITEHAQSDPNAVAMRQKRYGVWNEITWPEFDTIVREVAAALIDRGVKKNSKIGILSENRSEWVLTQFATQAAGATVVGMYPTSPAAEIEHLVKASDTEILFIEDQEQFDKIVELEGKLPKLKKLIVFDPKGLHNETYLDLVSFDDLRAAGQAVMAKVGPKVHERMDAIKPDDTALMVFTSGSTGAPKAAEISHDNFHQAASLAKQIFGGLPDGLNMLSYLPLCHVAEQNMTVINALAAKRTMNFGESLRTITLDLRDVAPEIFFGVPRIWEKMQAGVIVQQKTSGPIKAWMTKHALASAKSRYGTPRSQWSFGQRLSYAFWDATVYRHIRSYLGLGKCRFAITAAAPISPDLLNFLRGIGVNVREIWGMTETSGAASVQPDWGESQGRVGHFVEGIEGKIAEDGELLVKGGIVFKGYYGNKKATEETIVNGWLHTGDIAEQKADGSFSIVDRKKDIMINAAGKNLTPSLIENTMKASPYIKECIVIADRRPYVTAIIQLDFDTVRIWAESQNVNYTTFRSLTENKQVVELIEAEVERLNADLARVEQVKKVWLLNKELDHDDGEVTATMKVRRSKIADAYSGEIEALYA